jgi:hypothetical protein
MWASSWWFIHEPVLSRTAATQVIMDNLTKKSKGFGFVQFTTAAAAAALKALKRIDVQGKTVRCLVFRSNAKLKYLLLIDGVYEFCT